MNVSIEKEFERMWILIRIIQKKTENGTLEALEVRSVSCIPSVAKIRVND